MNSIYNDIQAAVKSNKKLLAVLIDPDKFLIEKAVGFIKKVNESIAHTFL